MGNLLLTTLFHSGANIMAVDRRLVTKSAYTGSHIPCLIFSGMVETCVFPIAVYQTSILHRSCRTLLFKKTCKSTDYRALTWNKEMHNMEVQNWYKRNGIDSRTIRPRCGGRQNTHVANTQTCLELRHVQFQTLATRAAGATKCSNTTRKDATEKYFTSGKLRSNRRRG